MSRIAIIGSGPAAFGALCRLTDAKIAGMPLEIEVLASGDPSRETAISDNWAARHDNAKVAALLHDHRRQGGGVLPDRHFAGEAISREPAREGRSGIRAHAGFGGIGNYWSASVLPARRTGDTLAERLGVGAEDYRYIAERLPVSGRRGDPLSDLFDDTSVNRPPLSLGPGFEALIGRHTEQSCQVPHLWLGQNRFAVETAPDARANCIECGDCLFGCPRDALFRAGREIVKLAARGLCRVQPMRAERIATDGRAVLVQGAGRTQRYDRVFLACGALETARLIAASFGAPPRPIHLYDTALWYLPLISPRPRRTRMPGRDFSFAELAGGVLNEASGAYNHILVSSFPAAVLQARMGRGGLARFGNALIGHHLAVAALYGSTEEYQRYRLEMTEGRLAIAARDRTPEAPPAAALSAFLTYLRQRGWFSHRSLARAHDTSGHYTADLGTAYGIDGLARHGRFDAGIFIVDSAGWDMASMSQQHSFTIMANAARLAAGTLAS